MDSARIAALFAVRCPNRERSARFAVTLLAASSAPSTPIASCVSAARAQKLFLLGIAAALRAGKVLDGDPERM
jgi:hypothetical protein